MWQLEIGKRSKNDAKSLRFGTKINGYPKASKLDHFSVETHGDLETPHFKKSSTKDDSIKYIHHRHRGWWPVANSNAVFKHQIMRNLRIQTALNHQKPNIDSASDPPTIHFHHPNKNGISIHRRPVQVVLYELQLFGVTSASWLKLLHCSGPVEVAGDPRKINLLNQQESGMFGPLIDVQMSKVHAVVARSTFPSQKCQKTDGFGSLLDVQMSKECTKLWREGHFQVKRVKNWRVGPFFHDQMSLCVAGTKDCAPSQKWAKRAGFVAVSNTTTSTR